MTLNFSQLPIGALFEFRGRRFEKLALAMARDEDRWGAVFMDQTEVFWHRRPGEEPLPPRPPAPPHHTPPSSIDGRLHTLPQFQRSAG